MYDKFIDIVSNIVKTYGVGILSDSKFWSILTDSYSFAPDYSLRDTFKHCISSGYVAKLVSLQGNKSKSIKFIDNAITNDKKFNKGNLAACLFSISIGIGSCSKLDYTRFIGLSPNNPKQKPTSKNKTKWKNPFSLKEWWILLWCVIWGIVASFGGTLFYSAFYNGWWLFFIVLFMGIAQLFYCVGLSIAQENSSNRTYKETIKSVTLPFILAIWGNALLSFFFFFSSFRVWLANHLHDYSSDEPTFITFLLCIIYVAVVGFGGIMCVDGEFDITKLKNIIQKKSFKWSFSLVVLGYIVLFFTPNIQTAIIEYNINRIDSEALENYNKKVKRNEELVKMRKGNNSILSFKNVKLGIDFDTDIQYANSNADFSEGHERHYSFAISKDTHPISLLLNENLYGYSIAATNDSSDENSFSGRVYSGETSIGNIPVELKIYERNGLVPLIIVESAGYGDFSSEALSQLKALYSQKYGEPELRNSDGNPNMPVKSEYLYSYYTSTQKDEDFVWTFPKGIIRLHSNKIIYSKPDFLNIMLEKYETAKQKFNMREEFIADSIRKHEEFVEQERQRKIREDSIRRVKNHKNAINEI